MSIHDFDKIYCLSLTNEIDRYNNCVNQFNKLNLSVDFWYTCKRKWNHIEYVVPGIRTQYYDYVCGYKDNPYGYSGFFNCALEQYTIIKTSYERGMNHIAIIEDDIKFIDDKNKILTYLNNIPNDFNIIKFQNSNPNNYILNSNNFYHSVYKCFDNPDFHYFSSMFYALDRKGMEIYIDYFDNIEFTGSDLIFEKLFNKYKNSEYKFYTINDIICAPNAELKSQIV